KRSAVGFLLRSLIMFQTFISRHNSNFFSDKLVLTSVTPASSAPVLQTPKATSSTLYFDNSSKKFKIAEGQWYRYAPSYVSPAYHLLEGFPFIQEPPSGDLQERVLIRHHDYDQCFQS